MRRFVFGFMWFIVFSVVATIVSGAIVGNIAPCPDGSAQELLACSQAAGKAFGDKYGLLLILGSLALAITGTVLQFLPGTKRHKK